MPKISAVIPSRLRDGLNERARVNDRSLPAEVRRAVTQYLTASPSLEMIAPVSSESSLASPPQVATRAGHGEQREGG